MMQFIWGLGITLLVGVIPLTIFVLPFLLRRLAEVTPEEEKAGGREILFATAEEGRARPVEWNNQFHHFIMSYSGHDFKGRVTGNLEPSQAEYWEIVPHPVPPENYEWWEKLLNIPAYKGLHFMGPPYIAQIPRNRFAWIEWGTPTKSDGTVGTEKTAIPHQEYISHVLLQDDVYFIKASSAESKEGVPVDVKMLFTIRINNPYKARYRVQNWLEAVTNQAEADVRTFVATEKILDLLTVSAGNPGDGKEAITAIRLSEKSRQELEGMLAERLNRFKEDYGVTVVLPQIQSVEPAGPDAAKYRAMITAEFEAHMGAKRTTIGAEAEATKITTIAAAEKKAAEDVLGAIAAIPGGVEMYRSQQIGKLESLNTLVEGDPKGNRPGIVLPTGRS